MSKNVRHYRAAWETEAQFSESFNHLKSPHYGWLMCAEGDPTKAFCKLCKCLLQAHKKDLSNHAKCKKHLDAFKYSQASFSNAKLTRFFGLNIPENRKLAELKLAAFIAEHGSISTVDHLGSLLPSLDKSCALLSGIKLHRTKCSGLISNVISPCMLEDLIQDIGDKSYSMIIDESTSVDTRKTLCIMVRYFSESKMKIVTTFYRLLEIDAGDADTLTNTFRNQLQLDGLDINNLIGIGVDGANVMVGEHHSFSSILREVLPHLITIKCVSHSLHLAAENACKVLPRHLEYIVRECHNWFSYSSKRRIEYSLLYETIAGKKPLKIDKLSGTRWLARISAITKILEQWDALQLHFQLAKDKERCYTSEQLYLMLSCKVNKLYLVFLKHSLKPITDCNRMFQSDNIEPLRLLTELQNLLLNYLSMLVPPNRLNNVRKQDLSSFNFRDFIMNANCINLGFSFNEESVEISDPDDLKTVKDRCISFLINLCQEIQKRVPQNFRVFEKVAFFSPSLATSQVRPDITDIVTDLKEIVGQENIDTVLNQWRVLPFQQWEKTTKAEEFWSEVACYKNAAGERKYLMLFKFVISILSLPFSNASVERAFSIMNIIKNKLRNRLLTNTADHIMRVRYGLQDGGCFKFEPTSKMLKKFKSEEVYNSNNDAEDSVQEILDGLITL